MALHRDIYWIGRQWAVTGLGVQAVDQRLDGAFDIEASGVWDESGPARVRAQDWVFLVDFERALAIARQRFPKASKPSLPLVDSVLELIRQPPPMPPSAGKAELQKSETAARQDGAPSAAPVLTPAMGPVLPPVLTPTLPPALRLQMRTQGALARFVPQWRVRR